MQTDDKAASPASSNPLEAFLRGLTPADFLRQRIRLEALAELDKLDAKAEEGKRMKREDSRVHRSGEVLTRAQAKARSLLTYTGGKACEKGHTRRFVSNAHCVACGKVAARKGMKAKRSRDRHAVNRYWLEVVAGRRLPSKTQV